MTCIVYHVLFPPTRVAELFELGFPQSHQKTAYIRLIVPALRQPEPDNGCFDIRIFLLLLTGYFCLIVL